MYMVITTHIWSDFLKDLDNDKLNNVHRREVKNLLRIVK